MKALLIFNPTAGQGRPDEELAAVHLSLGSLIAETVITEKAGDAAQAARRAGNGAAAYDAVFAAGGDGTVNEVINGLMTAERRLPLGLIPLGTRNVLARELGVPRGDLVALAGMLEAGKTRPVDLGRVGDQYFSLMAGFGFDAEVINEVLLPVKEILGPAAYGFAMLGVLAKVRSSRIRLTLDGDVITSDAFLVIVANAATYAYRQFKPTPFAAIDDGWLDICLFERPMTDKVGFVTQVMAIFARRHLRDPKVRYFRAKRVEIDSDPPIRGQIDGDPFGMTPLALEVCPRVLECFAP